MKSQRIVSLAWSILVVLFLSTCAKIWTDLDNPADPKAQSYPGYETVLRSADILPVSPVDAGTLVGATLTLTKVKGATAYYLLLAGSAAALETSPIVDMAEYSSNILDLSAAPLADSTTYYWKVQAMESSGSLGIWSPVSSFSTQFLPAATPTFSPVGGYYATDQTVTLSCATANSTIHYTTNGDTPTTGSTQYSGTAITATVDPAMTIQTIATAALFLQSAVATAEYRHPYSMGDTGPAGGLVFYDKGSYINGWRFLEAAPSDQSTGILWFNGSYTTTGASGTAIGSGAANTTTIVASQGAGSYAAKLCAGLVLGGYNDWFLPSKDELNQMYVNLKQQGRGGFASAWYWSSSESNYIYAWYQVFSDGRQGYFGKNSNSYVRAARAF